MSWFGPEEVVATVIAGAVVVVGLIKLAPMKNEPLN